MVEFKRLNGPDCLLGENAYWNPLDDKFYYCDIMGGNIYSANLDRNESRLELETDYQIGSFLFDRHNNLLILTEKGIFWTDRVEGRFILREKPSITVEMVEGERFNDAIVDARGRIIAGLKKADNMDGKVLSIGHDGASKVLISGTKISNGMGFSPNGKKFYHTDSGDRLIRVFDYDVVSGNISNGEVLIDKFPDKGEPDGMTVDADGCIWTACWGSGTLARYSARGELMEEYLFPTEFISSVALGGMNLNTLFVTTATCCVNEIEETDGRCYYGRKPEVTGILRNMVDRA